ncbi:ShlB/FhaC/HecB family hemolysin secretion/activation protein [Nitrospira sp. NS4]|uniref:ShlB/FhaC/HecB family hemolysin secretion/activation protein n=1 Tax=Nitrospira sp. NS4 TaxID=3414498 RepID=UPI003C2BD49F
MNRAWRAMIWALVWWSMDCLSGGACDARESRGTANGRPLAASAQESPGMVRQDNPKPATGAPARREAEAGRAETQPEMTPAPDQQAVRFAVTTFIVEGNTILDEAKIETLLDRFKGSEKQIADVEASRLELEKLYHAAGYPTVLVNLPEQTIEGGVVRLQVIESRLMEITVTGNRYYRWSNIRGKLPSVQVGALLYEPTFVKELATLNGNPDLKVAPILKPGTEPGTVNLELRTTDRLPVHGKLEADNKGPITTPSNRLTAEIQHTNVFGGDEILTVNTVQTPTDWGAVQNYGMSFVYPVKWPDHLLAVYASKSQSNSVLAGSGIALGGGGDVSFAGNATIGGARYIMPLFSGGKNTHQLSVGMDYKRLERTTASFPDGGTATVLGPLQYTPAFLGYTGFYPDQYGLTKAALSGKGYVAGMISGGSKEDFAGDPNDPYNQPGHRKGSSGTFGVVQGALDRIQALPGDFSLALHVDGQWATEPLIPAEQYFAGGMDTVRGYLTYEAIGDYAVRGRAELTTPELIAIPIDRLWQRRKSSDYTIRVKAVAFYDVAQLWIAEAPAGQTSQFRLEGVGGGLRIKFPKDVGQLIIDDGFALKQTLNTKRGDTFIHFSVGLAF